MHLRVLSILAAILLFVEVQWAAGVGAAGIGLNFEARRSKSSPSTEEVLQVLKSHHIGKIRLQDADLATLRALSGEESIEVIVGVRNDEILDVGMSPASANRWVERNVLPHVPRTRIVAVAVGDEVLTSGDVSLAPFLVPAMRNLHAALFKVGLEKQIKVSTPQSVLLLSSYFSPSSVGDHSSSLLAPVLDFLSSSGSYFMLNVCPLDLIRSNVPLQLSSSVERDDGQIEIRYSNMLHSLMNAVFVAMVALDHPELSIVVFETGWSRTGVADQVGQAGAFRDTLAEHISSFLSTSLQLKQPEIDAYFVDLPATNVFFSSRRFLERWEANPDHKNARRKLADKSWCVAKSDASTAALQAGLDWACGQGGADCGPIQSGQNCFLPNTVAAHASYAFNSYYQKVSWASGSCDFGGVATITTRDPSNGLCLYTSSTSSNGTPSTPTGTTIPDASSSEKRGTCHVEVMSTLLILLLNRAILG